jgi:predicted nuclease of predicted toxin-antitoxin system
MDVRFLLDEDTERALAAKLSKAGHDVERVVAVDSLGEGSDDSEIREHARATQRIIVTYDDDFFAVASDSHAGLFFLTNQHLSAHRLFTIIQTVLDNYDRQSQVPSVVYISENWL